MEMPVHGMGAYRMGLGMENGGMVEWKTWYAEWGYGEQGMKVRGEGHEADEQRDLGSAAIM